jgi:hypothetical protein
MLAKINQSDEPLLATGFHSRSVEANGFMYASSHFPSSKFGVLGFIKGPTPMAGRPEWSDLVTKFYVDPSLSNGLCCELPLCRDNK